MKINNYIAPFKREIWEHKTSFIGVFSAMGGLLIVALLFGVFNGAELSTISIDIDMDSEKIDEVFSFEELIDSKLDAVVVSLLHAFIMISILVSVYYLLSSLYDDRKDRSILFWKSLPVSETRSVLTKFLTGVYVVPMFALVIGLITSFAISVIVSLWLPTLTDYGVFEIWGKFSFVSSLLLGFLFIVVTGIWISPFFAWLIFASAASKRSPLMFATVPPILIVIVEHMLFRKSFFGEVLHMYRPNMAAFERYDNNMSFETISALIESFLMGPQIIVGLIVTALFIAGSVWLRNNRYEI